MRRTFLLAGAILLLMPSGAHASFYIPGQTRDDGLYVPPHFRAKASERHAAEAWFDALAREAQAQGGGKLPSAAAGALPSPSLPPAKQP